ncbi:hypothetical protein Riv7116_1931 [Rivularia sp. PCC 7116]|nr:hypothetical protein Riv7116_1931 [Rivularia sp. PCC 7116]
MSYEKSQSIYGLPVNTIKGSNWELWIVDLLLTLNSSLK